MDINDYIIIFNNNKVKGYPMKKSVLTAVLLSLSFVAVSAPLSPLCEDYLKKSDEFIEQLSKTQGMEEHIEEMKQKYNESKKEFFKLPAETQEGMCERGIEAMSRIKQMMKEQSK